MVSEIHVFDLDDTLVDSAAAVIGAYREAAQQLGCILPSDFYGRSADEWNCPPQLHVLKCQLYAAKYAAQVRRGWAAEAMLRCKQLNNVRTEIWTAASLQSVVTLRNQPHLIDVLRPNEWYVRQTVQEKANRFAHLYSNLTVPVAVWLHYYDDNPEHIETITGRYIGGVVIHRKGAIVV